MTARQFLKLKNELRDLRLKIEDHAACIAELYEAYQEVNFFQSFERAPLRNSKKKTKKHA